MPRQNFEHQMPNERNPSTCACAEDDDDRYMHSYYRPDVRGSPIRLYGKSGGDGYTLMTVLIIALVCIIIGFLCAKFNIPMRFFSHGGGGEVPQ